MSADEGTIQDNNLGRSSLEPTLQKEQESESRHEVEKGMAAEPATAMTAEETVRDDTDQPENEEEEKVEVAEGGQELKVIPENEEEEKEDMLLTTTKEPKVSSPSSKKRSKTTQQQQQKTKEEEVKTIPLTALSKQLDKQSIQINKIMQMLQPVQKQFKSAERQLELIKQFQSQLRELQNRYHKFRRK